MSCLINMTRNLLHASLLFLSKPSWNHIQCFVKTIKRKGNNLLLRFRKNQNNCWERNKNRQFWRVKIFLINFNSYDLSIFLQNQSDLNLFFTFAKYEFNEVTLSDNLIARANFLRHRHLSLNFWQPWVFFLRSCCKWFVLMVIGF